MFCCVFRCFWESICEVVSRKVLACFSVPSDRRKSEFGLGQTQFYAKMLFSISVGCLVPKSLQNDAFWATSALCWAFFLLFLAFCFWRVAGRAQYAPKRLPSVGQGGKSVQNGSQKCSPGTRDGSGKTASFLLFRGWGLSVPKRSVFDEFWSQNGGTWGHFGMFFLLFRMELGAFPRPFRRNLPKRT